MRFNRNKSAFLLATLLILLCGAAGLRAQTTISVNEAVARKNLVKQSKPHYPPIARAEHVTGKVLLEVGIGIDGHVTHLKALSGPQMLQSAAMDAVQHWEFKPFLEDGQPAVANTTLLIKF